MPVQSSPSPRQNTRGIKTSQAPALPHPQAKNPHNAPMGRLLLKESSESFGEQTKTWHPGEEIAKAWTQQGQNWI